jgi:hypothetical protein
VPHPITADTDCLTCHGPDGVVPAPDNHASFDVTMCTQCHQATLLVEPAPVAAEPPPLIPHPVQDGDDCTQCHGEQGISPAPADHTAYTLDMCLMCHEPAPPTPTPTPTPLPPPTTESQPAQTAAPAPTASAGESLLIPHEVIGREACLECHATGRMAVPDNHEGRTDDTCLMCHQPAGGAPAPAPSEGTPAPAPAAGGEMPGIPHPIEGQQAQCRTCHATGSIVPFPADHEPFKNAQCLDCHQPEAEQ